MRKGTETGIASKGRMLLKTDATIQSVSVAPKVFSLVDQITKSSNMFVEITIEIERSWNSVECTSLEHHNIRAVHSISSYVQRFIILNRYRSKM